MDEDVGVHNMKLYLSPAPTSDITVKYNISTGYGWVAPQGEWEHKPTTSLQMGAWGWTASPSMGAERD